MRTTVTIDEDVAKRLARLQRDRGIGFKQALNEVIRAGLASLDATARPERDVRRAEPLDLGRQLIDVTNVGEALAIAEGDPIADPASYTWSTPTS